MIDCGAVQKAFSVGTYADRGLTLVRGEGAYLYSQSGARYLDLMSGYGAALFGYRFPALEEAWIGQLQRLAVLHGSFAGDTRAVAARGLVQRLGAPYRRVYWSNSGAEAVEAALKFAVLARGGRKKFVACRGAYHGKTLGALSATHGHTYRERFEPLLWRFEHVVYGDSSSLERAVDDDTAAFMVEPVQGEGGVIEPPPGFLSAAARLCRERGVLLILDEIQTGCGRTGTFLAAEAEGVTADIVCLGKGLAGGLPLGATVVDAAVAGHIGRAAHTTTLGGNPLACAGVTAVLQALDEDRLRHIREIGSAFRAALAERFPGRVRGRGLMLALALGAERNDVLRGLQRERVLAIPAGEDAVRFLPPYVLTMEHLAEALAALDRCHVH